MELCCHAVLFQIFKDEPPTSSAVKHHVIYIIIQYFNCYSDMLGVEGMYKVACIYNNMHVWCSFFHGWILCLFFEILEFKSVTKVMCKLPSYFCGTLFKRIDTECKGKITRYDLLNWNDSFLICNIIAGSTLGTFVWDLMYFSVIYK